MQHKDPELMKKINTYIGDFYLDHDRTPSTTEIARTFGISRSSAQRYLVAMNANGIPCNMINCFCMFSNYIPLTLDDWIKLDKGRRERMNLEKKALTGL